MKGVYFLIGVALFVACAFVFINEHGKFYESFDGTNTQATANSQQPNTSSPGTSPSASVVGGGVPSTTSSNTTPTPNANDTPQTPGSTTANPAVSTPSQQDLVGYIDAVSLFSMGVASKGGKDAVLAKLSPDDVSYFNTLYAEIAKIIQYSMAPVTFPYTSAQTANKTKEYIYANQYITVQLSNTPVGASTMRTFVQGSVAGITAPITAGGTNTGSGSGSAGSTSASAGSTAGSAGDVLFNQSVYGKDSGNVKQEYTRISHTIRDNIGGTEDGSIEMSCFVAGAVSTFLQLNGVENEVNCLKNLDMTGKSIISNTGDMLINTATSTGTGNLSVQAKGFSQFGGETGFTNLYNTNGDINITAGGVASDLILTCPNWESSTSGGNSGQHLRIKLNGVYYKIALQND